MVALARADVPKLVTVEANVEYGSSIGSFSWTRAGQGWSLRISLSSNWPDRTAADVGKPFESIGPGSIQSCTVSARGTVKPNVHQTLNDIASHVAWNVDLTKVKSG